jgi:hypothetical protein
MRVSPLPTAGARWLAAALLIVPPALATMSAGLAQTPPAPRSDTVDPSSTHCTPRAIAAGNRPPVISGFSVWPARIGTPPVSLDVRTSAIDPDGDMLNFTYSASSGQIMGHSAIATWLIFQPGLHIATVLVDDGHGCVATRVTDFLARAPAS